MSDVTAPVKCKIEEVFDQSFIELLRLVPLNPYVRALVLKLTGKLPATECETFEQIQEWVELNCKKRIRTIQNRSRNEAQDGIAINVEFSEREYGRADYSVSRSGSEPFHIGADELLQMVQEAIEEGEGMDGVIERITNEIEEDAWNECDPSMDDYDDYEYNEHEATDSGEGSIDYSKDQIRQAVLAFVRSRHPELAAEL